MLHNIFKLKDVFPGSNQLPEFYDHLLKVEMSFNHSPFTIENFEEACTQLALAQATLHQALSEKDKFFYQLLRFLSLFINSFLDKKNIFELKDCKNAIDSSLIQYPELKNTIHSFRHFLEIFETLLKLDDGETKPDDVKNYLKVILTMYFEMSGNILGAINKISNSDYDITNEVLSLSLLYLANVNDDNVFISPSIATNQMQQINLLLNADGIEERNALVSELIINNKSQILSNMIVAGTLKVNDCDLLEAEKAYKQCCKYAKENTVDNRLKIQAFSLLGHVHLMLFLINPDQFKTYKITSKHFFDEASNSCQTDEELEEVLKKMQYFETFRLVLEGILGDRKSKQYLIDAISFNHIIFKAQELYSLDDGDEKSENMNEDNKSTLSIIKSFFNKVLTIRNTDDKLYFKMTEQDHLIRFHLSSIDRLLGNSDTFISNFLKFITNLQFVNKNPSEYKSYSHHDEVLFQNLKYFLSICFERKIFNSETAERIDSLIEEDNITNHTDLYILAREFSEKGYTTAATVFMNIGLLFEGITSEKTKLKKEYITAIQTESLKDKLWDASIYKELYLAPTYLNLLIRSNNYSEKNGIDLNERFKKVVRNITHQKYKLFTETQANNCEKIILAILTSPDDLISLENGADYKAILETLFVTKLVNHMAQLIKDDHNHFVELKNQFDNIFPQWKSTADALFDNLMPKASDQVLYQAASSSPAQVNKEESANPIKKKARTKKAKQINQTLIYQHRKHQSPSASMSKNIEDNKVPEHIAAFIEEQINKSENNKSKKQPVVQINQDNDTVKKTVKHSRRLAIQQANISAFSAPVKPLGIQVENSIDDEEVKTITPANIQLPVTVTPNNATHQTYISTSSLPAIPVSIKEENSGDEDDDTMIASLSIQSTSAVNSNEAASCMSSSPKSITLIPVENTTIAVPAAIKSFIKLLKETMGSKRTALVGGYIRDQLRTNKIDESDKDYDIVTDIPIAIIKQKFPELFAKRSFSDDYHNINYLGMDIDLKFSSHLSYKELSDLDAYRQDARSRDFTCNALYADENGCVYDPLDVGMNGLKLPYLITVNDVITSFLEDPIKMFRAINSTIKGKLEFSTDMEQALRECVELSTDYFSDRDNLGKINSLMHKLLCQSKGNAKNNFEKLVEYGFIKKLFPDMHLILQTNSKFKEWVLFKLNHQPDKPSLNFYYAMFILGSKLLIENSNQNIVCDYSFIKHKIINSSPLLKKNFETRRDENVNDLIIKSTSDWIMFINPNMDYAASSFMYSDGSSSSSVYSARNTPSPYTPFFHSRSSTPSSYSGNTFFAGNYHMPTPMRHSASAPPAASMNSPYPPLELGTPLPKFGYPNNRRGE
ncbi:MAG: hypothetical protein P4M12_02325 [Gammaproteobacteria bacterium]|nr:hypothetical protein [Gammaproteobacteria bacterium]